MWAEIINGAITQTVQDTDPVKTADGTKYPGAWPKSEIPNLVAVTMAVQPNPAQFVVTGSSVTLVNGLPVQTLTTPPVSAAAAAAATYAALMAGGLKITSTSTPAVNGTYAVNQAAQQNIMAVDDAILTNGGFLTGASQPWPLLNGTSILIPSPTVFKAIATAIGVFIDEADAALQELSAGGTASWPPAAVTIA